MMVKDGIIAPESARMPGCEGVGVGRWMGARMGGWVWGLAWVFGLFNFDIVLATFSLSTKVGGMGLGNKGMYKKSC